MSTWLFEIDRFDINRTKHSKMQRPSISVIFSIMFLSAIACSIYTVSLLFVPLKCNGEEPCLSSSLITRPRLQLYLFSTTERQPISEDVTLVYSSKKFNYTESQTIPLTLDIPRETRDNGTLYLYIMLIASSQQRTKTFRSLQKDPTLISSVVPLTRYIVPEAEAYHLLEDKNSKKKKKQIIARPVTHLRNKVTFTIMTEDAKIPLYDVPIELKRVMRVNRDHVFLPVVAVDFLQTRHSDFVKLASTDSKMNVTVSYTPISLGKLRLALHVEATVQALTKLGFSEKDVDHIKEIMADTNIYLLPITLFIAAVHMLFDFLAFKNDVSFWRRKDNLVGLSASTVLWRAFSQVVIFLYLLNEGSSLLILIPAGIGTIIEFWKSKKILRAEIIRGNGLIPKIKFNTGESNGAEAQTREFDAESMRYLSYLLCPLVIAGAIYSLLYQSHRSWYSWTINSLVKGVYAFGFLFMLPQLFVNYKLKSVAHLPWKAFMYKACNTFIDDVFAFIITMPVAHRVACFRDDAVFLVYLYQRWLYPVDKSRIDSATIEEEVTIRKVTKKTN